MKKYISTGKHLRVVLLSNRDLFLSPSAYSQNTREKETVRGAACTFYSWLFFPAGVLLRMCFNNWAYFSKPFSVRAKAGGV